VSRLWARSERANVVEGQIEFIDRSQIAEFALFLIAGSEQAGVDRAK
jgi:hypothetical protein